MSDHLFALRLFARVARKGSFSAAGRELGIPQSTASRTIAALEREIGTSLLTRNTRAVTLTDVGAEFLVRRGGRLRRDSVSVPLSGSSAGWVHSVSLPGLTQGGL